MRRILKLLGCALRYPVLPQSWQIIVATLSIDGGGKIILTFQMQVYHHDRSLVGSVRNLSLVSDLSLFQAAISCYMIRFYISFNGHLVFSEALVVGFPGPGPKTVPLGNTHNPPDDTHRNHTTDNNKVTTTRRSSAPTFHSLPSRP